MAACATSGVATTSCCSTSGPASACSASVRPTGSRWRRGWRRRATWAGSGPLSRRSPTGRSISSRAAGSSRRSAPSRAGRRPRTILGITASVRAALHRWLAEPVDHLRDVRAELLLKLVLAELNQVDVRPLVVAQRAAFQPTLDALAAEPLRRRPGDALAPGVGSRRRPLPRGPGRGRLTRRGRRGGGKRGGGHVRYFDGPMTSRLFVDPADRRRTSASLYDQLRRRSPPIVWHPAPASRPAASSPPSWRSPARPSPRCTPGCGPRVSHARTGDGTFVARHRHERRSPAAAALAPTPASGRGPSVRSRGRRGAHRPADRPPRSGPVLPARLAPLCGRRPAGAPTRLRRRRRVARAAGGAGRLGGAARAASSPTPSRSSSPPAPNRRSTSARRRWWRYTTRWPSRSPATGRAPRCVRPPRRPVEPVPGPAGHRRQQVPRRSSPDLRHPVHIRHPPASRCRPSAGGPCWRWPGRRERSSSRTTTTPSSATSTGRSSRCSGSTATAAWPTSGRSRRRCRRRCASGSWWHHQRSRCACAMFARLADLQPPHLTQAALAALLTSGRFDRHLRRTRKVYRARQSPPRCRTPGRAARRGPRRPAPRRQRRPPPHGRPPRRRRPRGDRRPAARSRHRRRGRRHAVACRPPVAGLRSVSGWPARRTSTPVSASCAPSCA